MQHLLFALLVFSAEILQEGYFLRDHVITALYKENIQAMSWLFLTMMTEINLLLASNLCCCIIPQRCYTTVLSVYCVCVSFH